MDPKLIDILKTILSKPELITETFRAGDEIYFTFKGVIMSILRNQAREPKYGPYSFYIYPKWSGSLSSLAHESSLGTLAENDLDFIPYHIGDYQNSDATALFPKIYDLVWRIYTKVNLEDIYKRILG